MIHYLSKNMADFFCKNKIIRREEMEVFIYGFELMISTVFSIAGVFLIGAFMGAIPESIVFLTIMIMVRLYSGGYHANTYLKCNLIFFAAFFSITIIYMQFITVLFLYFTLPLGLLSVFIIMLFSPIENKNKPIKEANKRKYKIISSLFAAVFFLISFFLWIFQNKLSLFIALTLVAVAILMVVEIIKKKRGVYTNEG